MWSLCASCGAWAALQLWQRFEFSREVVDLRNIERVKERDSAMELVTAVKKGGDDGEGSTLEQVLRNALQGQVDGGKAQLPAEKTVDDMVQTESKSWIVTCVENLREDAGGPPQERFTGSPQSRRSTRLRCTLLLSKSRTSLPTVSQALIALVWLVGKYHE